MNICAVKKYNNKGLPQKKMPSPPPLKYFSSCWPGERLLLPPPLDTADHDIHSLHSVCLRELQKKPLK